MSSNLMHTMGTIGSAVKGSKTQKGTTVAEFTIFFNDYVPVVGRTTLEVYATVFGHKAEQLIKEAEKFTNKDGKKTNGKGMQLFFVGYPYTHEFQDRRYNKFFILDWLFNEAPVFHGRGVIATEVEVRTVHTKVGKATVAQVPVYFNGYVPGIGNTSFESQVTLWREKAEWLFEQAQKHTNKNEMATGGRGMAMEFICYEYTDKFQQDGKNRSVPKLTAIDIKFPNIIGSNKSRSETSTPPPSETIDTPPVQETVPPQEEFPNEEVMDTADMDFSLPTGGGSADDAINDLYQDFDDFLKYAEKEVGNQ